MKYYLEDDVMDLIREAEDCERAYEWGEGHRRIHFEDYHHIEIPDKHGDLIDRQAVLSYFETAFLMGADMDYEDIVGIVSNPKAIPTIVEATE